MVTDERARELLEEMPEAQWLQFNYGIGFRVRARRFAVLMPGYVRLRVGVGERRMLLASSRAKFASGAKDAKAGWVTIRLQLLSEEEFRELVVKAWRHCVPPTMSYSY